MSQERKQVVNANGIQIIAVLATFGLFFIENLLKIPEIHVVWRVFYPIKCEDVYKSINISKGRQPRLL